MGLVRTNTLPELDPKLGQNQYKLASSNRMRSGKEVERMVQQARDLYARIIQEHRGTPWAIQAKREKNLSLGLEWQPSSDKKADE
jgi:HJR/Mrr/RecB family endonuclease